MSTNYGRTNESSNNIVVSNVGSNNQYGSLVTSVPAGIVTALDVYCDGSGGTCRFILCLWDSSGVLLAQTAQFTASSGSGGVHGQTLHHAALTAPLVIAGGNYYVGFWRNAADGAEWSYLNSGGTIHPQAPGGLIGNVGSPGNLSFANSTTGQMTAYLEWQPSGVYVYDGSAWQASPAYVYDGSAWQLVNGVYVYDGSAWQLVN